MRSVFLVLLGTSSLMLSACAALGPDSALGKVSDIALETIGLKKAEKLEKPALPTIPEIPELQKPPRNVALQLHAGTNLNAGNTDRPLSLLTRVYKLKQTGAFYSAPYEAFLSPEKEKAALGADLIEVRELNMIPGQLYSVTEKVSRESAYVGIVTLFRTPAAQRWRAAFVAKDAEGLGIIVGLHACSLTVGKGASMDQGTMASAANTPSGCE
jgi:type VI secretion system protein VasD